MPGQQIAVPILLPIAATVLADDPLADDGYQVAASAPAFRAGGKGGPISADVRPAGAAARCTGAGQ